MSEPAPAGRRHRGRHVRAIGSAICRHFKQEQSVQGASSWSHAGIAPQKRASFSSWVRRVRAGTEKLDVNRNYMGSAHNP
ncbi:hypothetical protein NDU88_004372 [Pleurodeles waltl]|uniref:Uncharacterized protein n=1 Tax=Pleurodeles waltl TaxID=8319 RepID=A0AAV7L1A9_PLEWA|nr:hypothetical protein NDU88_004372 [Pleurodeles waltl]